MNAHANTKSGSRSLRGPVIGLDGRRIVTSDRGPGREEWCDLSFKKVQFYSDFSHIKAHLTNGSGSPWGPVIGLDGCRIVALRTGSRGVARWLSGRRVAPKHEGGAVRRGIFLLTPQFIRGFIISCFGASNFMVRSAEI